MSCPYKIQRANLAKVRDQVTKALCDLDARIVAAGAYWDLSDDDITNNNSGSVIIANDLIVNSLSGSGDQIVTVSNTGVLGTTAFPPDVYWELDGDDIQNTNVGDVLINAGSALVAQDRATFVGGINTLAFIDSVAGFQTAGYIQSDLLAGTGVRMVTTDASGTLSFDDLPVIPDVYWEQTGSDIANTNTGQVQLLNTVVVDSLSGVGDRLVTTNNDGVLGTTAIPVIPDVYWEAVGSNIQNTNADDVVIQEDLLVSNRIGVNQSGPTYEVDITKATSSDNGVGVRIQANATTPEALVLAEQSSGSVWFGNDSGSFVAKTESLHGFPQFVIQRAAPQDTLVLLATGNIKLSGYTGAGGSLLGVDGAGEVELVSVASTTDWTLSGTDLYPDSVTYDVGIGTTSPTAKLDVDGTLRVRSDAEIEGTVTLSGVPYPSEQAYNLTISAGGLLGAADPVISWFTNSALTPNDIWNTNSGNVGIGTSSPAEKLDVLGISRFVPDLDAGNILAIRTSDGSRILNLNAPVAANINDPFVWATSNAVMWTVDSSEAFRINSDGNVGVNTPAPARRLHATSSQGVVAALTGTNVNGRATIGFEGSGTGGGTNQIVCGALDESFIIQTSAATRVEVGETGQITLSDLSGSGTRMVTADATGNLSTQAIPSGGGSDVYWGGNLSGNIGNLNTGNVGVGTNSPARQLAVSGSQQIVSALISTNTVSRLGLVDSATTNDAQTGIGSLGDDLQLYAGAAAQVTVTEDSRMGVNVAAPTETLDVNGEARIRTLGTKGVSDEPVFATATGVLTKSGTWQSSGQVTATFKNGSTTQFTETAYWSKVGDQVTVSCRKTDAGTSWNRVTFSSGLPGLKSGTCGAGAAFTSSGPNVDSLYWDGTTAYVGATLAGNPVAAFGFTYLTDDA